MSFTFLTIDSSNSDVNPLFRAVGMNSHFFMVYSDLYKV